ncbi:MAG: helix-turn-helix transcriptional regulator [Ahrensia sp.]|nr:helix-turn-helix transcriptional regulator [Ahrensia sp.]
MDCLTPVEKIRDAITRRGMKKSEIANRAGLHRNRLNRCEQDDWNPCWLTLKALADAVDIISSERA